MIVVQIAGRLGREPEVRFTPSGQKVTKLSVATSVYKGGKEETVWWNVSVWGDRFDKMISFLKKGSAIIAIGEMSKPEIYTDKEGRPQVSMDLSADILKFSPSNSDQSKSTQENSNHQQSSPQQQYGSGNGGYNAPQSQYSQQSTQQTSNYGQAPSRSHTDMQEETLPF